MNRRQYLAASFAALCAGRAFAEPAPEPSPTERYVPDDWLAFASAWPAVIFQPRAHNWGRTPEVLLYRDGRIFWRDDFRRSGLGTSPDLWRTGKVSEEARRSVVARADQVSFFTVPYEEQKRYVLDSGWGYVGVWERTRKRVAGQYHLGSPEGPDDGAYDRALKAVWRVLRALIPKEGAAYEPVAIRVIFAPDWLKKPDSLAWPLEEPSRPRLGDIRYYSGDEMQRVIEVLSKQPHVRVGNEVLCAWWAPAINLPSDADLRRRE